MSFGQLPSTRVIFPIAVLLACLWHSSVSTDILMPKLLCLLASCCAACNHEDANCNTLASCSFAGKQSTIQHPDNAVLQDRSEAMREAGFEHDTPPPEKPSLRQSYASTTSDQSAGSADPLSSHGNIVSNGFEPMPQRLATILSGVSATDANTPSAAEIGDVNAQVQHLM